MKDQEFQARSKLWIVDHSGNVVFGGGRIKILEAIQRTGSINAAAKDLKMSYRAVWGRIRASEKRLGRALLIKNVGGNSGGGSRLTPFALDLLEAFEKIQHDLNHEADIMFEEILKKLLNS